jgi:hypothetical protein
MFCRRRAAASCPITLNLRGKATLPASASDGTLLGTSGSIANTLSAVTIVSTDQTTAWKYVWVEQLDGDGRVANGYLAFGATYTLTNATAELSLFNPPGTGTAQGINVQLLGPALLYTAPITTWRLGVYSDTTGYPTCGTYYEGRIWLGGAVGNRFDACVSNGISGGTVNFAPTNQFGVVAGDNAISYTLNSDSSNKMFWMQGEEKGIVIGTQAGEFLVQAPTTGPLSPTNIAARRVTKIGCADIEPRRTEHTIAFVKRYARKLMEFFSDVNFGKFSAPNLADKAGHIVSAGIAEIAYTEAVTPDHLGPRCRRRAVRRDLQARHPDDLAAADLCGLAPPHARLRPHGGKPLQRPVGRRRPRHRDAGHQRCRRRGIRHVELLTDTPDENTDLADAWFLDNAVTPTSTSVDQRSRTGGPMAGHDAQRAVAPQRRNRAGVRGGLDLGDRGPGTTGFTDFVVASGSVTIPFGDSISSGPGRGLFTSDFVAGIETTQIVVGFTYNSDGQMVRPMQGALSKAVLGQQGLITEAGYQEQADSYTLMANTARTTAAGEEDIANKTDVIANQTDQLAADTKAAGQQAQIGDFISGALKGVAAVASIGLAPFTGGASLALGGLVMGGGSPSGYGSD